MALTPEEFIRKLQGIPAGIRAMNQAPAIGAAVPEVFGSVRKNFSRQVDDEGNVWPPRKDKLPHPLLILGGDMLDAATGGLGSHVSYTRDGAEIGIRGEVIPYASIHQDGSEKANIPARKYFYLHSEERESVKFAFGKEESLQFRRFVIKSRV